MNRFAHTAIAFAALFACATSHAETFYYSYKFHTGYSVTGSFEGTANGNLVTGISDIVANFQGQSLGSTGPMTDYGYNNVTNRWTADTAVLSFDGHANNFGFAANQFGSGNMFFMAPDVGQTVLNSAVIFLSGGVTVDQEGPGVIESRWKLTRAPIIIPAIPEPETYAMMLTGIGILGFAARRKRTAV